MPGRRTFVQTVRSGHKIEPGSYIDQGDVMSRTRLAAHLGGELM